MKLTLNHFNLFRNECEKNFKTLGLQGIIILCFFISGCSLQIPAETFEVTVKLRKELMECVYYCSQNFELEGCKKFCTDRN